MFEKEQILSEIAKLERGKQQNTETSDWLETQARAIEITKRLHELKLMESKINDYEKKIESMKKYKKQITKNKLTAQKKVDVESMQDDVEDDILIEDPEVEQDILSDEEDSIETYEPTKVVILI